MHKHQKEVSWFVNAAALAAILYGIYRLSEDAITTTLALMGLN